MDAEVAQGVALEELGREEEAIAAYRRALETRPDYAEVHFNLGSLFLRQENLRDAEDHFRKAVAIDGNYLGALNSLALILRGMGRDEEALSCLQHVYERDAGQFDAIRTMPTCSSIPGRLKKHWLSTGRQFWSCPRMSACSITWGCFYFRLGILRRLPTSISVLWISRLMIWGALCNLGSTYVEMKRFDDGTSCWRKTA